MTEREVSKSPFTLEDARKHMHYFASARDWGQYHTPHNLLLALVGEVGEVCEIFQWKSFCTPNLLSEEDRIHLGQELSDVIAYSTRLADRCAIDLAASLILGPRELLQNSCHSREEEPWVHLSFDDVNLPPTYAAVREHPRKICLLLSTAVGSLSRFFFQKDELQCGTGLTDWTPEDRALIAASLNCVIFSVVSIAGVFAFHDLATINNCEPFPVDDLFYFNPIAGCTISLKEAYRNKMALNEQKYPVGSIRFKYLSIFGTPYVVYLSR